MSDTIYVPCSNCDAEIPVGIIHKCSDTNKTLRRLLTALVETEPLQPDSLVPGRWCGYCKGYDGKNTKRHHADECPWLTAKTWLEANA